MKGKVMNCKELHELIPDLAAGFSTVTAEMNQHLQSCPACAGELGNMRQTMALLDEWQAPEPSPYFDTRLGARLREEKAKQPLSWLHWIRRPALAASLAAVLAVGVAGLGVRNWWHASDEGIAATLVPASPGTAVGDLQALDKNNDLYADFDVLDDLQVQDDVNANP
jgi:anti-sigma factor RsiW